jgi:hypothetical protein
MKELDRDELFRVLGGDGDIPPEDDTSGAHSFHEIATAG